MVVQDKIRLFLGLLLVSAGVVGFYLLPANVTGILRVFPVLLGVVSGALVILLSDLGRQFISFAKLSILEVKKVVWLSPQETIKLTGLVFVFVFILSLFMWLVDSSLSWFFYDFLLRRE